MNSGERERAKKHVAGVFFHLLSSTKKQKQKQKQQPLVYNKFGGDDKIHISSKGPLITDEKRNYNGLSNTNNSDHTNTGMQHPGLVARLMGLESMPVACHKKAIDRYEACEAKELRPPKRKKPVSPPPEHLPSKNRRARRQQQQKLFSPVKSPRNAVRTIGQSRTGRDKCEEKVNIHTRKLSNGIRVEDNRERRSNRSYERKNRATSDCKNGEGRSVIARSGVKEFSAFGSGPNSYPRARAKEWGKQRVESESMRPSNSKHSIDQMEANSASSIEGSNVASFTFSSPVMRNRTQLKNKEVVDRRRYVAKQNSGISCRKNLISDEKVEMIKSRGANSRGNEVLEEILSMRQPCQQDSSCLEVVADTSINDKLQVKAESSTTAYSVSDGNCCSPFSILEASFSNDSCVPSSPYSSSGRKQDIGSALSCNNVWLSDQDVDLLDSASSFRNGKSDKEKIPSSLSENSVSNARLLLGSIFPTEFDGKRFLSDTVEAVMKCLDIHEPTHGRVRKLLFDRTIECMDSKCNDLFEASRLLARRENLARDLQDEIIGLYGLSGKVTSDLDLVRIDLGRSDRMWAKFADEACHIEVLIGNDILNELVEETVMNICT